MFLCVDNKCEAVKMNEFVYGVRVDACAKEHASVGVLLWVTLSENEK